MSIGDFVSKTAYDTLGRIIAAAPGKFIDFALSAGVVKVELTMMVFLALSDFLKKTATPLYRSVDSYYIDYTAVDSGFKTHKTARPSFSTQVYLIWHRPVSLEAKKDGKGSTNYSITYLRGFNIQKLLDQAVGDPTERELYYVTAGKVGDAPYLTTSNQNRKSPRLWESPAYQVLEKDLRHWLGSRDRLESQGWLWRRGWLLHGAPGNGKTHAATALAKKYGLHLVSISPKLSDKDFGIYWKQIANYTPAMVVIDDIDDVIQGRDNIKDPKDGLAFSTLLNCLDGTNSINGVLTVISTNRLDAIDPALGRPRDDTHWNQLSTRPGRLDRCVRFDNPDLAGRIAIGRLLLTDEAKIQQLAAEHVDVSIAQFHSVCQEAAYAEVQGEE